MKRPCLRVAYFGDVALEIKQEMLADLRVLETILPFPIYDYDVVGSSARQEWLFRSDLDICLRTKEAWLPIGGLWRINPNATRRAVRHIRTLYEKWGVRFEITTEEANISANSFKTCFALKENRAYNTDRLLRVSVDLQTGSVLPAERNQPNVNYSLGWYDKEGEPHSRGDEQWPDEVAYWKQRYGAKYLNIGDTVDTAYLKT